MYIFVLFVSQAAFLAEKETNINVVCVYAKYYVRETTDMVYGTLFLSVFLAYPKYNKMLRVLKMSCLRL